MRDARFGSVCSFEDASTFLWEQKGVLVRRIFALWLGGRAFTSVDRKRNPRPTTGLHWAGITSHITGDTVVWNGNGKMGCLFCVAFLSPRFFIDVFILGWRFGLRVRCSCAHAQLHWARHSLVHMAGRHLSTACNKHARRHIGGQTGSLI